MEITYLTSILVFFGLVLFLVIEPTLFLIVFLLSYISKEKWIIPISAILGTTIYQSIMYYMKISGFTMSSKFHLWSIVTTLIASLIQASIIYYFKSKRAKKNSLKQDTYE